VTRNYVIATACGKGRRPATVVTQASPDESDPELAGLTSLTALVAAGQLRVEVDTVLSLEQVAKAHEIGQTGRTKGKIVLTL
jgi:NADPH:quinone reductase-like Zn-dependent oxidoreductase